MSEEQKQEEVVVPKVYIKCGHCSGVSEHQQWLEKTLKEGYDNTVQICPICGCKNAPNAMEVAILNTEVYSDNEDPKDDELYTVSSVVDVNFTDVEVDRLAELKKQKSEIEKEEKKLSAKIKEILVNHHVSEFKYGTHKLCLTFQDRSTMDEDKLVGVIKSVLTEEEIETYKPFKQISNPEAVTAMLSAGKITMEQLIECKIPNIIPVFSVDPKPRKETASKTDPFGGKML